METDISQPIGKKPNFVLWLFFKTATTKTTAATARATATSTATATITSKTTICQDIKSKHRIEYSSNFSIIMPFQMFIHFPSGC
jgi:hypothetical protein